MELLEKVLDDKNLYESHKQVYKNKVTGGDDRITIEGIGVICMRIGEKSKNKSEIESVNQFR